MAWKVTDYLTYEGGKFSKSRNIGVFGDSAQKSGVSADIWRYYLLSHRPETGDTDFEWAAFISSNNNELLKNLGNFVSRIVKFAASKHYDGVVPSRADYHDPTFDTWTAEVNKLLERYIRELDAVKLRAGITTVLLISQQGNQFLQSNGLSNKLVESEPSKCAAVVNYALHLVHLLAAVLEPYMPDTAKSMNAQLGAEAMPIPDVWTADSLKAGHKLGKPELLFSRIPPEKEQEWREAFGDDEVKKLKEEEAAKKAARKAAKKSKKPAASK
jgi:methionyl-tRNA synthetase